MILNADQSIRRIVWFVLLQLLVSAVELDENDGESFINSTKKFVMLSSPENDIWNKCDRSTFLIAVSGKTRKRIGLKGKHRNSETGYRDKKYLFYLQFPYSLRRIEKKNICRVYKYCFCDFYYPILEFPQTNILFEFNKCSTN